MSSLSPVHGSASQATETQPINAPAKGFLGRFAYHTAPTPAQSINPNRINLSPSTQAYKHFTTLCAAIVTAGAIIACYHPVIGLGVVLAGFALFFLGSFAFLIATKFGKENVNAVGNSFMGMVLAPIHVLLAILSLLKKVDDQLENDDVYIPIQSTPLNPSDDATVSRMMPPLTLYSSSIHDPVRIGVNSYEIASLDELLQQNEAPPSPNISNPDEQQYEPMSPVENEESVIIDDNGNSRFMPTLRAIW
jgi:hypothetical protein